MSKKPIFFIKRNPFGDRTGYYYIILLKFNGKVHLVNGHRNYYHARTHFKSYLINNQDIVRVYEIRPNRSDNPEHYWTCFQQRVLDLNLIFPKGTTPS